MGRKTDRPSLADWMGVANAYRGVAKGYRDAKDSAQRREINQAKLETMQEEADIRREERLTTRQAQELYDYARRGESPPEDVDYTPRARYKADIMLTDHQYKQNQAEASSITLGTARFEQQRSAAQQGLAAAIEALEAGDEKDFWGKAEETYNLLPNLHHMSGTTGDKVKIERADGQTFATQKDLTPQQMVEYLGSQVAPNVIVQEKLSTDAKIHQFNVEQAGDPVFMKLPDGREGWAIHSIDPNTHRSAWSFYDEFPEPGKVPVDIKGDQTYYLALYRQLAAGSDGQDGGGGGQAQLPALTPNQSLDWLKNRYLSTDSLGQMIDRHQGGEEAFQLASRFFDINRRQKDADGNPLYSPFQAALKSFYEVRAEEAKFYKLKDKIEADTTRGRREKKEAIKRLAARFKSELGFEPGERPADWLFPEEGEAASVPPPPAANAGAKASQVSLPAGKDLYDIIPAALSSRNYNQNRGITTVLPAGPENEGDPDEKAQGAAAPGLAGFFNLMAPGLAGGGR